MYALGEAHNWTTLNEVYDADRIAVGQMYLDVYEEKKEPGIIDHLQWVLDAHIRRKPKAGIPVASTDIHNMKLIKDGAHIVMFVDNRRIIDWTDDGSEYGQVLEDGKMGLRQMQWTHFRYRNFRVFCLDN